MMIARLRTRTSGMVEAPSGNGVIGPSGGARLLKAVLAKPSTYRPIGDHAHVGLKAKRGGVDEFAGAKFFRDFYAVFQRLFDFMTCERADVARDGDRAEVGVGCDFVRGDACDGGMARQINGVGNDRCSGIGLSGG